MKVLVVLASLAAVAMSQRPSYAGLRPKGFPELAGRFKGNSDESNEEVALGNRLGADTTAKIPVDALGDVALVNRLNQWPKENRPFWLINADHIERHRNPEQNVGSDVVQSRGSFGETIPVKPELPKPSFAGRR